MTRLIPLSVACIAIALGLVACSDTPPPTSTSSHALSASIHRLAPDTPLGVSYWPFAEHVGDEMPTLDPIPVDAVVDAAGCGALEWADSPIPGGAPGPYCVGRIGGADGLVVMGRPGTPARLLVPGTARLDPTSEGFAVQRATTAPTEELLALARQWAATPGAQR